MKEFIFLLLVFGNFRLYADPHFSWDEIKRHSSSSDCWLVIDGSVYDVTRYISKHPSDDENDLLRFCGKDATEGWKTKGAEHKPHSKKANRLLPQFKVGALSLLINEGQPNPRDKANTR